jgi:hypothetical protein
MLTLTVPALTLLQQTTKNPDIPSPLPFDVTTRGQFSCVTVPKSGDLIAKALVVREKTSLNERTLKPNNTETLPDGSLRECFSWFQRSATYIIQMTYSDGTMRSIGPIAFVVPLPGLYPLENQSSATGGKDTESRRVSSAFPR